MSASLTLAASLTSGCASRCGPDEPVPTVLLVSWDTTRADALGAYADVSHWDTHWRSLETGLPAPSPRTPVVDALAAEGLRFRWALSHAPTTLSAHASLFTGLDQHGHQVVRNGFPLPDTIPAFPWAFSEAGWHTVGVVGASVLERRMGLDGGFSVYDDDVRTAVRNREEDSAEEVVARVLHHVDARPEGRPLFVFAHFFDAHSPWTSAPEDLRQELLGPDYGGPVDGSGDSIQGLVQAHRHGVLEAEHARAARALYLAEVAAQDRALGELLEGLEDRGLTEDLLVVLVGDHGEALDDSASAHPYGHGPDVDLPLIHVPFIVHGRGVYDLEALLGAPAGARVDAPVSLSEVGPTLLELAEVPMDEASARALGRQHSLAPLVRTELSGVEPTAETSPEGAEDRVHLAEATKPFDVLLRDGRWPNLPLERAAVGRGHVLITAPWQGPGGRLYELAPGQPVAEELDASGVLAGELARWDLRAPGGREVEMTEETERALRALGYLDE